MKYVVLSADGNRMAYSVPDIVADNLEEYCLAFCRDWLWKSPHAAKYRLGNYVCYTEADFIAYLNQWVFPEQPSVLAADLGWIDLDSPLPEPYTDCPWFNF